MSNNAIELINNIEEEVRKYRIILKELNPYHPRIKKVKYKIELGLNFLKKFHPSSEVLKD